MTSYSNAKHDELNVKAKRKGLTFDGVYLTRPSLIVPFC